MLISRFPYVKKSLHFNLEDFQVNFIKQFASCFFWCLYQILLSNFLSYYCLHYILYYQEYCISYHGSVDILLYWLPNLFIGIPIICNFYFVVDRLGAFY